MRFSIILIFSFLGGFISAQSLINHQWSFSLASGPGGNDIGKHIKTDNAGNVYVLGEFSGKQDFDPSPAESFMYCSDATQDVYLTKYGPSGNYIWSFSLSGNDYDIARSLDIDGAGNIYITVSFLQQIDADPSPTKMLFTSSGLEDVLIAKYSPVGSLVWAHKIGGTMSDHSFSGILSQSGDFYVTGVFRSTVDFDPSPNSYTYSATGLDGFVAKYSSGGALKWAKQLTSTQSCSVNALCFLGTGNIAVIGNFRGTTDFDPSASIAQKNATLSDIFIAEYDTAGNYIWANSFGGTNDDFSYSVCADPNNNICVTGMFLSSSIDFDPSQLNSVITNTGLTAYIAKYDFSGNFIWTGGIHTQGASPICYPHKIIMEGNNICIGGKISGIIDFDTGIGQGTVNVGNTVDAFVARYDNSGSLIGSPLTWGAQGFDIAHSLHFDGNNFFITGEFAQTVDFDSSAVTFNQTSVFGQSTYITKYSAFGNHQWTIALKDVPGNGTEDPKFCKTDQNGNIFVGLSYRGILDTDPGPGYVPSSILPGGSSSLFAKYSPAGNLIWAKALMGYNGVPISDMAFFSNNDIVITGRFADTADFDPLVSTMTMFTHGYQEGGFLAKYNSSGNLIWAKKLVTSGPPQAAFSAACSAVSVDGNDRICVTGNFSGTIDFDPGPGTATITSYSGQKDLFYAQYDSNGNFIYAKRIGGNLYDDYGVKIFNDTGNNVYLAGLFTQSPDFDPGPGTATLTASGAQDLFFAKFDQNGNYIWARSLAGQGLDQIESLLLNSNENRLYLIGTSSAQIDLDPSPASFLVNPGGGSDFFISKYDINGNFINGKMIGGANAQRACAAALDNNENIIVTGFYSGYADFDPSPAYASFFSNNGSEDGFIAKYDSSYNYIWASAFGGQYNYDWGHALSTGPINDFYLVGTFRGTANIDPVGGNAEMISQGATNDVFLARYTECTIPNVNSVQSTTSTVCLGSSVDLSVNGTLNSATNWGWYDGGCLQNLCASGVTVNITPTVSTTYYVMGTGGCLFPPSCSTITILVDTLCSDVWPGDANSDGSCNNVDFLELGLHFNQNGVARSATSNTWQSFYATNWNGNISNGKNICHSDCDGNGSINLDDTLGINLNLGLTHAFKNFQAATNPIINIVPDQPSFLIGTWGSASIFLGDSASPMLNITGISFDLKFDETLIEPDSIYINYLNSFIDQGQNIYLRKKDFQNGVIHCASTHTNKLNVSGYGKIAELKFKSLSSIPHNSSLQIQLTDGITSSSPNGMQNISTGTCNILFQAVLTSLSKQEKLSGISINPNPATDYITIETDGAISFVEIFATDGIKVGISHSKALSISHLPNGIYILKIHLKNGSTSQKKVILQH